MRAYQLPKRTGIDDLTQVELPMPKPGPRQVLVKIAACSLNYHDLAVVLGTYRGAVRENVIPLSDGAGEVVDTGADVSRIRRGDRVAANFFPYWTGGPITAEHVRVELSGLVDGVLAEYAVFDEDSLVALPDHLSFEEGATLPCAALTAWHGVVVHGQITPGQVVLTQGTGGVSVFALQFASLMGAQTIVISSSDEKLARAKALGATHTINHKTEPEWHKVALEITGGRGVDHVIEIGGAHTLENSLRAVRIGGRISVIGVLSGAGQINPTLILMRRANLYGMSVGSVQMFETMNRAIAAAKLKPVTDKVFAFEDAREALRYLQSAKHFGKIVIQVS
jgi:NADPH:quinone reductase-like Zn-dependent oxidoreductase